MRKQTKSSWESSAKWYDEAVGKKGHYYHEKIILPNLISAMKLEASSSVLDLGCGQGILERALPKNVNYCGVDVSKSLIASAKKRAKRGDFFVKDLCQPLSLPKKDFSHAAIILALQNMQSPEVVLQNASSHLKDGGKLFIVLNHPCFRIPRQTHWEFDEKKKLQYRRCDSYLSSQKIPIKTSPGKEDSEITWSFHHPLSSYMNWLAESGFCLVGMQEWVSDKKSEGGRAKIEDRARKEFPLFLLLICQRTELLV